MSEQVMVRFAADTADPIVLQLGTTANPQDLTGWSAEIRLKDVDTGEVITAGTTTIRAPVTSGVVERYFENAERVVGRHFVVECITTDQFGRERTWPGRQRRRLEIIMEARRTAA